MKQALFALLLVGLMAAGGSVAYASHAWGNYHWARTANPFTLKVVDSVTQGWDAHLDTTISDWSLSSVLNLVKESGSITSSQRRQCRAIAGKIRVCNQTYGNNGWLGIAQIWITGNEHITQATTKVNDTYFNTATYNTPAWRNLVMCQEVGHDFGLDHQDEAFDNPNLGTCMDYTSSPGTNQHPNAHDYEMLETMYAHLDTSTTVAASLPSAQSQDEVSDDPRTWGREVRVSRNGEVSEFERTLQDGTKVLTHVFWATEGREHRVRSR